MATAPDSPSATSRNVVTVLPTPQPRLLSIGTANPPARYTQEEVASLLSVPEGVGRRFFRTAGIETRYLYLEPTEDGLIPRRIRARC